VPARRAGNSRLREAYAPPSLQAVTRDFAFLVAMDLPAQSLVHAVKNADKALISAVRLFDRFAGAGVPAGQISLALEVTYQPVLHSLTEADLRALSERIVAAAAKLGAHLRT
ncbi:MAG: phenylalanine--tRNA ligase subunit beta, partial [Alphaproteobacteria bacterium]|nr:phenylalanine--tRNA ligase subunit beta [Alphaproteobacteria bacterium]